MRHVRYAQLEFVRGGSETIASAIPGKREGLRGDARQLAAAVQRPVGRDRRWKSRGGGTETYGPHPGTFTAGWVSLHRVPGGRGRCGIPRVDSSWVQTFFPVLIF